MSFAISTIGETRSERPSRLKGIETLFFACCKLFYFGSERPSRLKGIETL